MFLIAVAFCGVMLFRGRTIIPGYLSLKTEFIGNGPLVDNSACLWPVPTGKYESLWDLGISEWIGG